MFSIDFQFLGPILNIPTRWTTLFDSVDWPCCVVSVQPPFNFRPFALWRPCLESIGSVKRMVVLRKLGIYGWGRADVSCKTWFWAIEYTWWRIIMVLLRDNRTLMMYYWSDFRSPVTYRLSFERCATTHSDNSWVWPRKVVVIVCCAATRRKVFFSLIETSRSR